MFGILGQRFRDTQRKPALGAQLISGHPLTIGATGIWLLRNNALNAVNQLEPLALQSGALFSARGVSLDGSSSGKLIASSSIGDTTQLTVMARGYYSSLPTGASPRFENSILHHENGSGPVGGFLFSVDSSGQLGLRARSSSNSTATATGGSTTANKVYTFSASYGPNGGFVYLDGVQVGSTSASVTIGLIGSNPRLTLGGVDASSFSPWPGEFEWARIWNRQLGPDEVQQFSSTPFVDFWAPSNILYSFPSGVTPTGFKPWFANATKLAA